MTYPIEPRPVVDLVERFVDKAHADAAKFDNVELLDESQVFSLHLTAAEIYALGFTEGVASAEARRHSQRVRDREHLKREAAQ